MVILNHDLYPAGVQLGPAGAVEGADAVYMFGDSYLDTGNIPLTTAPYGKDWPGYPDGRWSDGRNLADYFGNSSTLVMNSLCF